MKLTRPNYEKAERLAQEILEANLIVKPPVIAADLAQSQGLKVICTEFKPEFEEIAGFIDTDEKAIVVNTRDVSARQNFTIAHELGHYLLEHHESSEYSVLWRNTNAQEKTPMEQEANCFAANLLVPLVFLDEYEDNFPLADNKQLGRLFGVSEDVIYFRKRIRKLYGR